jgi:methylated-DNA-[protein]-cysteine S-methyltransferase
MPPLAAFAVAPAPWGAIHVAATAAGVVAVELDGETPDFVDRLARRLHGIVVPAEDAQVPPAWRHTLAAALSQIAEYLAGKRRVFELPVDLRVSDWDRLVLTAAARVPYGETISYGELARRIGHPGANQAVGGAMGRNPIGLLIPCHRVVAKSDLGGYGGSTWSDRERAISLKRALLRIEGAIAGPGPGAVDSAG